MIQSLQALRLVFVMLIFMSHFNLPPTSFDFGGDCGVAFFFMLSGFVLALSYGKSIEKKTFHHKRFLYKRLSKLYPLHLLCLFAFIVLHLHRMNGGDCLRLLPNLFLLQSWLPDSDFYYSGNGVSWFLSSLLPSYIIFPWIYKGVCKLSGNVLAVSCMLWAAIYILCARHVPEPKVQWLLYVFPPTRMTDFTIGVVACRVYTQAEITKRTCRMRSHNIYAIGILLLATGVAAALSYPYLPAYLRTSFIYWPFLPAIIILATACDAFPKGFIRVFRMPLIQKGGDLSFEIFMVHQLVINLLLVVGYRISPHPNYALTLALCLSFTFVFAWMTRRIISFNMGRTTPHGMADSPVKQKDLPECIKQNTCQTVKKTQ